VTNSNQVNSSGLPTAIPEAPSGLGTMPRGEPRPAGEDVCILHDAQGRRITYVRVSLTDRCNFRCRYCMPTEGIHKLAHREMLSLEELAALIRVLVAELGIEKVRITGGEPLIRRGVIDFITAIAAIPGLRDLSMTTNAYYLAGMAEDLYAAGIHRLNISLDTLQPERFAHITLVDGLAQVLQGIERARQIGFSPIKLNTVITRENLDEAAAIVRFAIARNLQPRFIELMPSHEEYAAQFVSADELRSHLAREFHLEPGPRSNEVTTPSNETTAGSNESTTGSNKATPRLSDATGATECHAAARLYRLDGGEHCCGFIAPMTHPFCHLCNRIRVRGDGHMLPCLSEDVYYDLKPYIRPELRDRELIAYLREVLAASKGHTPAARRIQGMWRIGG